VCFNLLPQYGENTQRQYDFMLHGLREVENDCARRNLPFVIECGQPEDTIPAIVAEYGVGEVITDFNPLREPREWRDKVAAALPVRLVEVDAHNIVPCRYVSQKVEFAAHTIRPKLHRALPDFLIDIPSVPTQDPVLVSRTGIDWAALDASVAVDSSVPPVEWATPGTQAGKLATRRFIDERLNKYDIRRNDPNADALSNLSPYLHFGQLSAQWVARAVQKSHQGNADDRAAFLEELIVRRELTDNYCFYNGHYDIVAGAPEWAQKTIAEHAHDPRPYLYTCAQLEFANTHDELWNAMQMEMVTTGKMHGWCRMYWAKKILEWTPSASEAISIALYLNDRYELDGTDPNGVVGIMWSICGVHDRAWTERPIFGKIRYMNYNGAKRKFDVDAYIARAVPQEGLFA
jgi:deoxyribodipyrimidine photo-lyase